MPKAQKNNKNHKHRPSFASASSGEHDNKKRRHSDPGSGSNSSLGSPPPEQVKRVSIHRDIYLHITVSANRSFRRLEIQSSKTYLKGLKVSTVKNKSTNSLHRQLLKILKMLSF